jgi:hypothetical protein
MRQTIADAVCSQCGRSVPSAAAEVEGWKHAKLVLGGDLDEAMLLCPECREEHRDLAYDEGGAE